ncbi:RNase adapter RapZ [Cryobacterium sp. TMT1-62]|uniref:RNase adapter RapZ n=1 Tax=Cryobacterium sandaracinum TaxID=1259247 RepID=A0ABY2JMD9_9MICO|nr:MULTISPECIES: RNase adapter RapZ [Cryobacterium]TFB53715.1 RNase adapter RapZ [Cryobacterium sp. Sr3]TFB57966.1 RNase adapter RapZ [Cryobacterium sp. Hz7]TFC39466.1 RNase adapter RapZ [Cryobacterium sp. TMT2-14]TFC49287.1 RNase adapter RapZ [Cryobacterium sp. TMT2-17-1]TFC68840.1 RNase adapter RapZ [Cryobacterium sp. TMT2-4]
MTTENDRQEMLIVTGMSGAGRSTVANALEDLGWYVVDNLPPQMLRPLAELVGRAGTSLPKIAAVVDIRGRDFFTDFQEILHSLRKTSQVRVIFLEARDDVLVRRFESVRRPHPLQGDGTILDGIAAERVKLSAVRESCDLVIDTSDLNIHQLATSISDRFAAEDAAGVHVTLMSFGFKYGLPTDVDMVADVRFLPNPFWVPELRSHNGQDSEVRDFVLAQTGAREFISHYAAALEPVLAGYQRENKRHATIAVGCTGGKHRSVAMAAEIAALVKDFPGVAVSVKNRDLGRE